MVDVKLYNYVIYEMKKKVFNGEKVTICPHSRTVSAVIYFRIRNETNFTGTEGDRVSSDGLSDITPLIQPQQC